MISANPALGAALFAAYALVLVVLGFRRSAGFASWHMFARISRCRFALRDPRGERFNPWQYLPHTSLAMGRPDLEVFLLYLRAVHGLDLEGQVHLREGWSTATLDVEATHVVDRVHA